MWNSCSYLEALHGQEEVVATEGGLVRLYFVKVSANSRAQTVAELEDRRKRVVINMLAASQADAKRALIDACSSDAFAERVKTDSDALRKYHDLDACKKLLIEHVERELAARVAVYKAKAARWFASEANFAKAVNLGLELRSLATAKPALALRDNSVSFPDFIDRWHITYVPCRLALLREIRAREQERAAALAEDKEEVVAKLALEECVMKRLVTQGDALEEKDECSGETALINRVLFGDALAVELLLQAKAIPDARGPVRMWVYASVLARRMSGWGHATSFEGRQGNHLMGFRGQARVWLCTQGRGCGLECVQE